MPIDETPPPAPAPASPSYEFNAGENKVFANLAVKMRGVGFWSMLYGILILLMFAYGCIPKKPVDPAEMGKGFAGSLKFSRIDLKDGDVNIDLGALVAGVIFLLVGLWSRGAASGFRSVAKTQGGDIGHLMAALKDLSKLYGFLDRLIFFVVLLITLGLIAMLIAALMGAPTAVR